MSVDIRIRAARALHDLGHLDPEHLDGCPQDEPCECPEYVLVGAVLNDEINPVEVELALADAAEGETR